MAQASVTVSSGPLLAEARFRQLAAVPAELEWFANIDNERTRRAYKANLADFSSFVGLARPEDFRAVTWAHVIAWRQSLESRQQSGLPSGAIWLPCRRCSITYASATPLT